MHLDILFNQPSVPLQQVRIVVLVLDLSASIGINVT